MIHFSAGIIIGVVVPVAVAVVAIVILYLKKRKKRPKSEGMLCMILSVDYLMILDSTSMKIKIKGIFIIAYSL